METKLKKKKKKNKYHKTKQSTRTDKAISESSATVSTELVFKKRSKNVPLRAEETSWALLGRASSWTGPEFLEEKTTLLLSLHLGISMLQMSIKPDMFWCVEDWDEKLLTKWGREIMRERGGEKVGVL
jgi:hypothetical protein